VFTRALHSPLSLNRSIQSILPYPISLKSILILWRIDPLLGNGSIDTFPRYTFLVNSRCCWSGPVNMRP
jgi:hypothetical protein